jgi:uncharacterized protein (TIGR03435 family)
MRPTACALLSLFCLAGGAVGQQRDTPAPTFEVVSIRPSKSDKNGMELQPSGRIIWTGTTLRGLMGIAYDRWAFDNREILGGDEWIARDRFDIIAQANGPLKVDPDGFPGPVFRMIRALIEDRFQVRVREEMRERPVYALVLANTNGALGPRLQKSTVDCGAEMSEQAKGVRPVQRPDGRAPCVMSAPPGRFAALGLGLQQMAAALSQYVGRPVVDRTGLQGPHDWDVEFNAEFVAPLGDGSIPPPAPGAFADRPSIFTALQEQLGLRLESTRANVDVLVIDRAERPTAD